MRLKLGMPGAECLRQERDAIINICQYSKSEEIDGPTRPFDEWKEENMKKCPQFLYWATVLDFELVCLQLVRAIREADFSLYLKGIREFLPWMFALDSHNYAR